MFLMEGKDQEKSMKNQQTHKQILQSKLGAERK
jgi:hypothetical protein